MSNEELEDLARATEEHQLEPAECRALIAEVRRLREAELNHQAPRYEVRLAELEPEWLVESSRHVGFTFRCFTHPAPCRPSVYFRNPGEGAHVHQVDGHPPLVHRHGDSWEDLTVEDFLDLGDCFRGALVDGVLYKSR